MIRTVLGTAGLYSPSLVKDFSGGVMPPGLTFSRSTSATQTNASGLVESVAANVPRLDYDPVTLVCRGLLIEESRTNLLRWSESIGLSSSWIRLSGSNVTASVSASPGGALGASRIILLSNSAGVFQSVSNNPAGYYTWSVWVKGDPGTVINLGVNGSNAAATNYQQVLLNGNWQRVSGSFQVSAIFDVNFHFRTDFPSTTPGYTVDAWGVQLEAGASASSYIPTTTTAVTRGADVLGPLPGYPAAGTLHSLPTGAASLAGGNIVFNPGHIRKVRYYPNPLPAAYQTYLNTN